MTSNQKVRPAKRLMKATGKCAKEGSIYGQCILQKYATIKHDDCVKEFELFKTCVGKNIQR